MVVLGFILHHWLWWDVPEQRVQRWGAVGGGAARLQPHSSSGRPASRNQY